MGDANGRGRAWSVGRVCRSVGRVYRSVVCVENTMTREKSKRVGELMRTRVKIFSSWSAGLTTSAFASLARNNRRCYPKRSQVQK